MVRARWGGLPYGCEYHLTARIVHMRCACDADKLFDLRKVKRADS